uniref:Transcription intermediary factor 1-beta-like n=1 Tax=Scophthalmus maximus TaxID=52904 RepID=A0A8D3B8P8_SCOMX
METNGDDVSQQCCGCDASLSRCWCVDCGESLCDDCVSAHRRVSLTRSHQILNQPPGKVSAHPTKFCRLHPCEPLKLYCFTCSQFTCRDCQLMAHMDHRYLFVTKALDGVKKGIEALLQPITSQRDTLRRSLQDLQTRLQDIARGESQLEADLNHSFNLCSQILKGRMDFLSREVKRVLKAESELIKQWVEKLQKLQQDQTTVGEITDRFWDMHDLPLLLRYFTKIKLHLQQVKDQDLTLPETMSQLNVLADTPAVLALLNFGTLQVAKVPFTVSQPSSQNPPPTSTCLKLDQTTLLQIRTHDDTLGLSSSTHNASNSSSVAPPTSTSPTPSSVPPTPETSTPGDTASLGCLSALLQFSSTRLSPPPTSRSLVTTHQNQVIQLNPVQPGSTLVSPQPLTSNHTRSVNLQSSFQVLEQNYAPDLNKSHSILTTNPPNVQQLSSWPISRLAVQPPLAMLINQTESITLPANTLPRNTLPAYTLTAKTLRANTLPTNTLPANTLPANTLPEKTLTKKTLPAETLPEKTLPEKTLTKKTLPAENLPSKTLLEKTLPEKTLSEKTLPKKTLPKKTLSEKTLSEKSLSEKSLSANALPGNSSAEENTLSIKEHHGWLHRWQMQTMGKSSVPKRRPRRSRRGLSRPGKSHSAPPNLRTLTDKDSDLPTGPLAPLKPECDVIPSSSSVKRRQSLVVRAVADSACDHRGRRVTARQLKPSENKPTSTLSEESEAAENKPTSTVSEETEPAENKPTSTRPTFTRPTSTVPKESEPPGKRGPSTTQTDKDGAEWSSVIGQQDFRLSQYQPLVSLFRLPSSLLRTGHSLPGVTLFPRDAKHEVYVEDMNKETQSHVCDVTDDSLDFTKPISSPESPESPVLMQIVICSACGSAHSSIICSACGRGFHRDCHDPPVGPDMWTEWNCSLCQDLSDPLDPYSSARPASPEGPVLSLLDQRRCETLLLHLKVEGCSRLAENSRVRSRLTLISERLSRRRQPTYQTTADFVSDIWSLFKETSSLPQDDLVVKKLQQSFHVRLMETFSLELCPTEETLDPQQQRPDGDLRQTRKKLREFLDLWGPPGPKRTKTDQMET